MKMIEGAKYMLNQSITCGGLRFNEGETFTLISYNGNSEMARVEHDGTDFFLPVDNLELVTKPKPAHYDTGIDTIAFLRANCPPEQVEGFLRGNALKYLQRYDKKNGVEDLRKAKHYVDMLIEELEGRE